MSLARRWFRFANRRSAHAACSRTGQTFRVVLEDDPAYVETERSLLQSGQGLRDPARVTTKAIPLPIISWFAGIVRVVGHDCSAWLGCKGGNTLEEPLP
jgi:hypothetical protein